MTLSGAAAFLNPPNPARGKPHLAVIRSDEDIRWRDDGTAPTASVGMLLAADEVLLYDGKTEDIRLIKVSATATVDVSYYLFGN